MIMINKKLNEQWTITRLQVIYRYRLERMYHLSQVKTDIVEDLPNSLTLTFHFPDGIETKRYWIGEDGKIYSEILIKERVE